MRLRTLLVALCTALALTVAAGPGAAQDAGGLLPGTLGGIHLAQGREGPRVESLLSQLPQPLPDGAHLQQQAGRAAWPGEHPVEIGRRFHTTSLA